MPKPDHHSNLFARREWLGAGLILFLFLVVGLLVATRTPTVYMDEPVFADPAANLYYGSGFTSTMWAEDRHELWSSQPPLYAGLLCVFFKCFGFGLLQARMANNVLAAAGALLIWAALRRTKLVQSPGCRLISLALILSGSVSVLTFRMVRYDVAMFFVSALVFFACSQVTHGRIRYLWVIVCSALCPFAGLPMLPFVGLLLVFQLIVYRFRNLGLVISVGTGLVLGIGLLALFYDHFGVLQHFFNFVHYATGSRSLKTLIFGDLPGDGNMFTSFFGNPVSFLSQKTMFDYSAFLLFLLATFISWKIWRAVDGRTRRLIIFILLTTLALPPVLHVAGHYWSYYRWMSYVPLAIAVPRLLELAQGMDCSWLVRRVAAGVIGLSLFLGMPLRTLIAFPGWSARSVTPLERVAAKVVQPPDVVVCNFKTYFAIRKRAQLVFCYGMSAKNEFNLIKDLPTNQVSLLCLPPENVPNVIQVIGGKWKKLQLDEDPDAAALSHTRYAVDFYRREPD